MDFFKFINSKDIRAHLEKIGYECSTIEGAWLVYQSRNATLEEKHVAWQEIIDIFPDSPIDCRNWHAPRESLHRFLSDYMALERKWLKEFYENDNAVYRFKVLGKDEEKVYEDESGCIFSCAEACLEAAKQAGSFLYDLTICLTKKTLNDENNFNYIEVFCRGNGDILSIDLWGSENEAEDELRRESFDNLWFAFPVPFQKGDILWNPKHEGMEDDFCAGPIVIEGTTPNQYDENGHEGYDTTDMNVWGYFQYSDGTIYSEVADNYMDFEYYPPEKLVGKRRILKALGSFMKEQIDVGLFAQAYHQILTEENAKECIPRYYTDEALRLAGLKEDI